MGTVVPEAALMSAGAHQSESSFTKHSFSAANVGTMEPGRRAPRRCDMEQFLINICCLPFVFVLLLLLLFVFTLGFSRNWLMWFPFTNSRRTGVSRRRSLAQIAASYLLFLTYISPFMLFLTSAFIFLGPIGLPARRVFVAVFLISIFGPIVFISLGVNRDMTRFIRDGLRHLKLRATWQNTLRIMVLSFTMLQLCLRPLAIVATLLLPPPVPTRTPALSCSDFWKCNTVGENISWFITVLPTVPWTVSFWLCFGLVSLHYIYFAWTLIHVLFARKFSDPVNHGFAAIDYQRFMESLLQSPRKSRSQSQTRNSHDCHAGGNESSIDATSSLSIVTANTRSSWWTRARSVVSDLSSIVFRDLLYVTIVQYLLDPLDCSPRCDGNQCTWSMDANPAIVCWTGAHQAYAGCGTMALLYYVTWVEAYDVFGAADPGPNVDIRFTTAFRLLDRSAKLLIVICYTFLDGWPTYIASLCHIFAATYMTAYILKYQPCNQQVAVVWSFFWLVNGVAALAVPVSFIPSPWPFLPAVLVSCVLIAMAYAVTQTVTVSSRYHPLTVMTLLHSGLNDFTQACSGRQGVHLIAKADAYIRTLNSDLAVKHFKCTELLLHDLIRDLAAQVIAPLHPYEDLMISGGVAKDIANQQLMLRLPRASDVVIQRAYAWTEVSKRRSVSTSLNLSHTLEIVRAEKVACLLVEALCLPESSLMATTRLACLHATGLLWHSDWATASKFAQYALTLHSKSCFWRSPEARRHLLTMELIIRVANLTAAKNMTLGSVVSAFPGNAVVESEATIDPDYGGALDVSDEVVDSSLWFLSPKPYAWLLKGLREECNIGEHNGGSLAPKSTISLPTVASDSDSKSQTAVSAMAAYKNAFDFSQGFLGATELLHFCDTHKFTGVSLVSISDRIKMATRALYRASFVRERQEAFDRLVNFLVEEAPECDQGCDAQGHVDHTSYMAAVRDAVILCGYVSGASKCTELARIKSWFHSTAEILEVATNVRDCQAYLFKTMQGILSKTAHLEPSLIGLCCSVIVDFSREPTPSPMITEGEMLLLLRHLYAINLPMVGLAMVQDRSVMSLLATYGFLKHDTTPQFQKLNVQALARALAKVASSEVFREEHVDEADYLAGIAIILDSILEQMGKESDENHLPDTTV